MNAHASTGTQSAVPPLEVALLRTQTIALPDGRHLCYDLIGDPDGVPVVFFHGVPGSRRYWRLAATEHDLVHRGVLLIAPDRPGMGGSDPHPGRSLESFADDVGHLAEGLGLDRYAMLAFSGGAGYALAAAARHEAAVSAVSLVAPMADLGEPRLRAGCDPALRRALGLLSRTPDLARYPLLEKADAAKLVRTCTEAAWAHLPAADRRLLSHDVSRTCALDALEQGAAQGLSGPLQDIELLTRPWEFELASVSAPVEIVSGGADPWSTDEMVHWLRQALPRSSVVRLVGEGHFTVLAHHASAVLERLVAVHTATQHAPHIALSAS